MTCIRPCDDGKKTTEAKKTEIKTVTAGDIFEFFKGEYFTSHGQAQQALIKEFSAKALGALGNWQELVNQHFSDRG